MNVSTQGRALTIPTKGKGEKYGLTQIRAQNQIGVLCVLGALEGLHCFPFVGYDLPRFCNESTGKFQRMHNVAVIPSISGKNGIIFHQDYEVATTALIGVLLESGVRLLRISWYGMKLPIWREVSVYGHLIVDDPTVYPNNNALLTLQLHSLATTLLLWSLSWVLMSKSGSALKCLTVSADLTMHPLANL